MHFRADFVILVFAWMAAAVLFLVNLCLILFQPRRSILWHGLFACCSAALGFVIWYAFPGTHKGWIMTLLAVAGYVVPTGVISQFVLLIVQTVRARRSVRGPLLVALMCFVVCGCAAPKQVQQPPSDTLRARFGNMALRLQPSASAFSYELPATKGVGAGRGAKAGAESGLVVMGALGSGGGGSGDGALYAAVVIIGLGVATTVVATPVGAVVGALRGVSADELRRSEASIGSVLAQTNVTLILRQDLLDASRVRANRSLLSVDELLPVSTNVQSVMDLELTYAHLGERGRDSINPPMGLELSAFVRVIDPSADEQLHSYRSQFKSTLKRKFTDWAADDAKALRKEFEVGCQALADDIVAQIFLRSAVTNAARKRPPPRTSKNIR
jgi:hypothetical protein